MVDSSKAIQVIRDNDMKSNFKDTVKILSQALSDVTAKAVNKATLTAFKISNEKIRREEGIKAIPIYRNVKFTRASVNRPASRLWIYDRTQVDSSLFNPVQTATGVTFMRPVKLGNKVITTVAHAFIPKRLNTNSNPAGRPFKRVGKARLPIVRLKTSTLYDYYLPNETQTRFTELYIGIFTNILTKEFEKRLAGR